MGPQGNDYAFKLEFDRPPFGPSCGNRCANATVFLDTDNLKATGLLLEDSAAPENGADLTLTVQGSGAGRETASGAALRVKVTQHPKEGSRVEDGLRVVELDPRIDTERLAVANTSVFILLDADIPAVPTGQSMRVIYHPQGSKALEGMSKGLNAPKSPRDIIFKDGVLPNVAQQRRSPSKQD